MTSPRSACTRNEKKRVPGPDTCRCRANELARFLTIGPTLVHAYFSITFSIQYPERGKEIRGTRVEEEGYRRGENVLFLVIPSAASPFLSFSFALFLSFTSCLYRTRVPSPSYRAGGFSSRPTPCADPFPLRPARIAAANRFVIVFVSAVVAADGVSGVISRGGWAGEWGGVAGAAAAGEAEADADADAAAAALMCWWW